MDSSYVPQYTLSELDREILRYRCLLESLPRSHPNRPTLLYQLAALRSQREKLSNQKSDLDKSITHLTEAILLPQTHTIIFGLFHLAVVLRSRFSLYGQPDDLKSSIKYFRFLRVNFHSLEAFDIPKTSGDLPSQLFTALARNLVLTPGDMVQDLEEMLALVPEFITADILTYPRKQAIEVFSDVLTPLRTQMFCRKDTQLVANRAIQVLREATALNPDLVISEALATCLTSRFQATLVMSDYEEAIAIADKIVATYSPGNIPTSIQRNAMMMTSFLLGFRLDSFSRPEYLEDAIHRIRTFVQCLPHDDSTMLANILHSLMQRRFNYFGVAGNSGGPSSNPRGFLGPSPRVPAPSTSEWSQIKKKVGHLLKASEALRNGEITDVEAAVERSRKLLPLQQSRDRWSPSCLPVQLFATILLEAYGCTKRTDYLNEAITTLRDIRKISASNKVTYFNAGLVLLGSLVARAPQ